MIPNTFCCKYLVDKFREEAKEKRWSYTTLMTAILEERYGKEKNEHEILLSSKNILEYHKKIRDHFSYCKQRKFIKWFI